MNEWLVRFFSVQLEIVYNVGIKSIQKEEGEEEVKFTIFQSSLWFREFSVATKAEFHIAWNGTE